MNVFKYFLMGVIVLIGLITPTTASISIENPYFVIQTTNANISFPTNQSFTSIEHGANYITLNGSKLQLTPTGYVNISINQFYTTNNYYNLSFNGSSSVDFVHTVPTSGDYQFIKDGAIVGTISTAANDLSGTITVNGNNTVIWELIVLPALTIACNNANNSLVSSLSILSLLAFVVGAVLLFVGFRNVDAKLMLAGIAAIVGVIISALFGIAIISRMGICQ